MVVVFGPPGAGKTTIANAALDMVSYSHDDTTSHSATVVGLDLDVCVPQWMKDNFAQGIYPTLVQRQAFAEDCCDYVVDQQQSQRTILLETSDDNNNNTPTTAATIVSFSFVNTDLRDVFRDRFPQAHWILVKVSDKEATQRIQQRKDHFYKGQQNNKIGDGDSIEDANQGTPDSVAAAKEATDTDNNEWKFAPVTFDHTILDGTLPVEENAQRVVQILRSILQKQLS